MNKEYLNLDELIQNATFTNDDLYELFNDLFENEDFDKVLYIATKYYDRFLNEKLKEFVTCTFFAFYKTNRDDEIFDFIIALKETPYKSQEVEEVLNALPKINKTIKDLIYYKEKTNDTEEYDLLKSDDTDEVLLGLLKIEKNYEKHKDFINEEIINVLKNRKIYDQNYYYILSFLLFNSIEAEFDVKINNDVTHIDTKSLLDTFNKVHLELKASMPYLLSNLKNMNLYTIVSKIAPTCLYFLFPTYFENFSINDYFIVLCEKFNEVYNFEAFEDLENIKSIPHNDKIIALYRRIIKI